MSDQTGSSSITRLLFTLGLAAATGYGTYRYYVPKLETERNAAATARSSAERDAREATASNAKLRETLLSTRLKNQKLQKVAATTGNAISDEELLDLGAQLTAAQDTIAVLRSEEAEQKAKTDELQSQLDELKSKLATAEMVIKSLETDKNTLTAETIAGDKATAALATANQEVSALRQQLSDEQRHSKSIANELTVAREELSETEAKLAAALKNKVTIATAATESEPGSQNDQQSTTNDTDAVVNAGNDKEARLAELNDDRDKNGLKVDDVVVVNVDRTNLMDGSNVIRAYERNTALTVRRTQGDWVSVGDGEGWVRRADLRFDAEKTFASKKAD